MASQTSFDWKAFNDSLADERGLQEQKRAQRDAADQSAVDAYLAAATKQANDKAERQAASEAGIYDQLYGGLGLPDGLTTTLDENGVARQNSGLTATSTRPGAAGSTPSNPFIAQGETGYTTGIDDLSSVKQAEADLKRRQDLENVSRSTSGAWETGSFAPARRQANEQKSPWDTLNEKLGVIQENAATREQDLAKQYQEGANAVGTGLEARAAALESAPVDTKAIYDQLNAQYPNMLKQAFERLNPGMKAERFPWDDPAFKNTQAYKDAKKLADQMYNSQYQTLANQQRVANQRQAASIRSGYGTDYNTYIENLRSQLTQSTQNPNQPVVDTAGVWDL